MSLLPIIWLMQLSIIAADAPPAAGALTAQVHQQTQALFDQARTADDYAALEDAANRLCLRVARWGDLSEPEAFQEAAFAAKLLRMIQRTEHDDRADLLSYLLDNRELAQTLIFLLRDEHSLTDVAPVLTKLRAAHGDELNDFAQLAAAICVVHDTPQQRRINENLVDAPDPVRIYEYFTRHETQMYFGLRDVPAELLIYVVDVTSPADELEWALGRYQGDDNIGAEFHRIRYDYRHVYEGEPKLVTVKGFSLPNIAKYGGVCADQAYYAVTAGKAIGVPTVYTRARTGDSGHAWVGFLQRDGRRAAWNFNVGRYDEYQGVAGNLINPQTLRIITDSEVSLLSELIGVGPDPRRQAAAITHAARLLDDARRRGVSMDELTPLPGAIGNGRTGSVDDTLEMLEAALRLNVAEPQAWFGLMSLAEHGELTLDQKRLWAERVMKLCGERYPDFAFHVLAPMIGSLEDADQQVAIWGKAFDAFARRKDLAAAIRLRQGKALEDAGRTGEAGDYYLQVIKQFANDGPFVVNALAMAENMLVSNGRQQHVAELFQLAWRRTNRPPNKDSAFISHSNWVVVGRAYADRLEQAGHIAEAREVRRRINRQLGR